MPKRAKNASDESPTSDAGPGEEQVEVPTRMTRSGRRVLAPTTTPGRRTRRSVAQEKLAAEDLKPESPVEARSAASPEPALEEPADRQAQVDTEQAEHLSGPAAAETVPPSSETVPKKKPRPAPTVQKIQAIPLGKPKSGRVWKNRNKQRFSALVRDKPLCTSWEKKMEAKREKELVKQYSLRLMEEKARKKEEKRKRREETLRRRAENAQKAEIVQVIRNTSKIKRMKKKQLRKIEKRDTLALLQKSQKQNGKTKTQKNVQELTR